MLTPELRVTKVVKLSTHECQVTIQSSTREAVVSGEARTLAIEEASRKGLRDPGVDPMNNQTYGIDAHGEPILDPTKGQKLAGFATTFRVNGMP